MVRIFRARICEGGNFFGGLLSARSDLRNGGAGGSAHHRSKPLETGLSGIARGGTMSPFCVPALHKLTISAMATTKVDREHPLAATVMFGDFN